MHAGKQYESCLHLREELDLPLHFPAAHCHGSLIHRDNDIIKQTTLDGKTVVDVLERTANYGVFVFIGKVVHYINKDKTDPPTDWIAVAEKYDMGIVDHSSDPERQAVLADIASGKSAVLKVTVCSTLAHIPGELACSNLCNLLLIISMQFSRLSSKTSPILAGSK